MGGVAVVAIVAVVAVAVIIVVYRNRERIGM